MGQAFMTERESRTVSLLVHLRDAEKTTVQRTVTIPSCNDAPREKFFVRLRSRRSRGTFRRFVLRRHQLWIMYCIICDYARTRLRLSVRRCPRFVSLIANRRIKEHGSRAVQRAINLLTDSPPFQQLACPLQSRYITWCNYHTRFLTTIDNDVRYNDLRSEASKNAAWRNTVTVSRRRSLFTNLSPD